MTIFATSSLSCALRMHAPPTSDVIVLACLLLHWGQRDLIWRYLRQIMHRAFAASFFDCFKSDRMIYVSWRFLKIFSRLNNYGTTNVLPINQWTLLLAVIFLQLIIMFIDLSAKHLLTPHTVHHYLLCGGLNADKKDYNCCYNIITILASNFIEVFRTLITLLFVEAEHFNMMPIA